jgi:hypothetical protein
MMDKEKWKGIWGEIYSDWVSRLSYYDNNLFNNPLIHLTREVTTSKSSWRYTKNRDYGWISVSDYKKGEFRNCGKHIDSAGTTHTAYLIFQALYNDDYVDPSIVLKIEEKEDTAEELAAIYLGAVAYTISGRRNRIVNQWRGDGYRLLDNIHAAINVIHGIQWHHAVTSTMPIDIDTDILICPTRYHEFVDMAICNMLVNFACHRPVVIHPIWKND